MFYFSILVSLIIVLLFANTSVYIWNIAGLNYKGIAIKFFVEIFFLQSYFFFSSFWGHHWSLSVEEHFYILLTILLFYLAKTKKLDNQKLFFGIALFIFFGCLALRVASNVYFPHRLNFFETHLRIDSLFAGVFISYFYNFNTPVVNAFYEKFKYLILLLIIPLLAFTPFIDPIRILDLVDPSERFNLFLAKTIGLTGVYLAFAFLLVVFIEEKNINKLITKIIGKRIFKFICTIGFYSYGIYLFHEYVAIYGVGHKALAEMEKTQITTLPVVVSFVLYFFCSIALGIIISKLIEIPFLKLREIYVPKRKLQNP
jgi:peptidoglycan/LPS O-acetylase OafA/YrhL